MKKMNNKGFMLMETLIVSTFLVSTLLFIYIQFNNINKTYEKSFKYNTVNSLYSLNNLKNYISNDGIINLKNKANTDFYVQINDCSTDYFAYPDYCRTLINSLNIKTAILIDNDNIEYLDNNLDQTMLDFINEIDVNLKYSLVAEFNDNTFAYLEIEN